MNKRKQSFHQLLKKASADVSAQEYERADRFEGSHQHEFMHDLDSALLQSKRNSQISPRHQKQRTTEKQNITFKASRKRVVVFAVVLLFIIGTTVVFANSELSDRIRTLFFYTFHDHTVIMHDDIPNRSTLKIVPLRMIPNGYHLIEKNNNLPEVYTESYENAQGNVLNWSILNGETQGNLYITADGKPPKQITMNGMVFYCMSDGTSQTVYHTNGTIIYLLQGVLDEDELIDILVATLGSPETE